MSNIIQFRRSTAILTLLAASIGGGLIAAFVVASRSSAPVLVRAQTDSTSRVNQLSNSFADIIEKASPAVVNIQSTRVIKASEQQGESPFLSDPFFRQFFGGGNGRMHPHTQREFGLGSGVIINQGGYILTNNHVVEKSTTVKVTLLDKREFNAKVVGTDPQTDVAVVKIDASNLAYMPLGNSDSARVGDLCFAIGNPFGEDHTVTMGIISAKGRSLPSEGASTRIQNFLQTDAAINPGNSGGALIDARGELIGINTMILTGGGGLGGEGGGNIGIGFAVPVNMAKQVSDQIIKSGKVSRGYLGVALQQLTPDLASQFGLKNSHGAIVSNINPGGPGDKAGFKQGDVVTAIDGKQVEDVNELTLAVTEHAPGSRATFDVVRDGKPMKITATLGQRPNALNFDENTHEGNANNDNDQGSNDSGSASFRGMTVEPLTPDLAQQAGAPSSTKGVIVDDVDEGGPAAAAGPIGRGTIITAVDRKPVTSVQEFSRLMKEAQNKSVLLTLLVGGRTTFVVVPAK